MKFDLPAAHRLHDPRLRELFALATAVGATMMADGDGSDGTDGDPGSTPPAGSDGQDGGQDGSGESGDGGGDGGDKPPSFDEFVAGLPEDQQSIIRAEITSRDKEMRKLRSEARNLRTRAQEAEAKAAIVDEAQNAKKTAEQKAAQQTEEATAAARAENEGLRKRLVTQEIKVQAAATFADPDDPAELLAGQVAELMDDDLEPDTDAISDALKDLLERKPHLAKQESKPRPPAPTKAQGSSGTPTTTAGSKGLAEAQRRFGQRAAVAS